MRALKKRAKSVEQKSNVKHSQDKKGALLSRHRISGQRPLFSSIIKQSLCENDSVSQRLYFSLTKHNGA
jgi:hypothetical protein